MRRYRKIVIGLACVLIVGLLMSAVPLSAVSEFFVVPEFVTETEEPPEIVEARTRTSKTYDLGDNKYALDIGIGSAHYRDEFGDWQEIDNRWSVVAAPWDWEMLEDGYHTSVLEDFTAGQILLFESQGESVAFQPMALQWTNDIDQIDQISMPQGVAASVSNDPVELLPGMSGYVSTIKWDDGYGTGRHFEWENSPGRLGKLLALDSSPPIPPQFIIDGGNPVLRLNFIFDPSDDLDIYVDDALWDKSSDELTFDTIEFRRGEGEDSVVLWGFMPAGYWDSNEAYGVGATELRKVGNSLYVSVRVPYEWLQTATYPVYIDPTLDIDVGVSLDDVFEEGGTIFNATRLEVKSATDIGTRWVAFLLPEDATIDVAYASFYIETASWDDINVNLYFEHTATPAQFTTNANDVTDRTKTTEFVNWVDSSIGVGWENTPSLVDALQEIVNDYSPTALVILGDGQDDNCRILTFDGGEPPKLHIEYTAAANTLLLQVAADLDDVYEAESSGDVTDADNIAHNSGVAATGRYWGAHRWVLGTSIPLGATIDECYVQFYSWSGIFDNINGNWHFEELAAPVQFTAGVGNTDVTERDRTETSVEWIEDSLAIGWHQSAELKTALQEVVDAHSPTVIALIFRPNQDATKNLSTRGHNYDSTLAARIFIKWTPAAAAEGYSYGTIIG